MLGGRLVVVKVRILLFYIINEAWKCKKILRFSLIYFNWTQVMIYTEEEMNG